MLKRFINGEAGATAIEYGLIASLFAVTIVAAFNILGAEYIDMFEFIETTIIAASNP